MFNIDINKYFEVTYEDREKSKTNFGYVVLNNMKDNWRLVGSIILIIMIWYYFTYLDTKCNNKIVNNVQSGGGLKSYKKSVSARAGSSWKDAGKKSASKKLGKAGSAMGAAPGKAAAYAQKKTDSFKSMSGSIYQIIYQVAMFAMMFIIFGPALALFAIMILCFAVLKQKILFVKEL
jgi:hypothetical protein